MANPERRPDTVGNHGHDYGVTGLVIGCIWTPVLLFSLTFIYFWAIAALLTIAMVATLLALGFLALRKGQSVSGEACLVIAAIHAFIAMTPLLGLTHPSTPP